MGQFHQLNSARMIEEIERLAKRDRCELADLCPSTAIATAAS
ncbi:MAG: hypothetical protein AAFY20_09855 [Cyanobacteria bacterium J06639_14]